MTPSFFLDIASSHAILFLQPYTVCPSNPNSWHNYPLGPWTSLVPPSELCEPFRPDSINKCLTSLGGAPFPGTGGKIKDKWRIIDSQLSARGISMTELIGISPHFLSFNLCPSHPLPICLSFSSAGVFCRWSASNAWNNTALNNNQQKHKTY